MSEETIRVLDVLRMVAAFLLIAAALMGGPSWLIITLMVVVLVGLAWSISRYFKDKEAY